jgi:predicted ATPase
MKVAQVVDNIAANVLPAQLGSLVMRGFVDQLAELAHLTPAQAAKTIERLTGTEALFEIERVELGDTAHIELKVDDKYQDVSEASRGQRGTAIVPLLLLLGKVPFVMDQPEDDLFARFKTSTIAKLLAKVKADRQIIVTTHDPNLVVLPEADWVIELGASKSKGFVRATGAATERRSTIEELDGGAEAFLKRKDFYGH